MKKILFSLMAVVVLTACNNGEDYLLVNSAEEVRVNVSIGEMTRVATDGMASHFENGDKIMVYGWTSDKTTIPANPPIASENTLKIENSVETWEAQPRMLWQSQTAAHYFIGIYPVRTVTNFSDDAYVLDETEQEEADLLVAVSDDQGIVANNRGVDLTFKHMMAKININMNFRNQWEATPTPSEVKLYCGKEATVNYLTQTVTADAYVFDATKYIAMPVLGTPVTGFDKSYSSIVIPQTGVNMVDIVIDGTTYRYEGVENLPFTTGKVMTLNLNVGKDNIELAGVTVGDWQDGATIGGGEAEEVIIHEYVDLGLTTGTLWAIYNVGATAPEEYGDYFAWGETAYKSDYSWDTYKYGGNYSLTKYCTNGMYGTVDNKTVLDVSDDAAIANWGSDWRMPTKKEMEELAVECTWTWTTDYNSTGVAGYIVSSKAAGNTNAIFLPAASFRNAMDEPSSIGSYGYYWCSSLDAENNEPSRAWNLTIYSGSNNDIESNGRYYGLSVRAVRPAK